MRTCMRAEKGDTIIFRKRFLYEDSEEDFFVSETISNLNCIDVIALVSRNNYPRESGYRRGRVLLVEREHLKENGGNKDAYRTRFRNEFKLGLI